VVDWWTLNRAGITDVGAIRDLANVDSLDGGNEVYAVLTYGLNLRS
jgi:hypothetical protein